MPVSEIPGVLLSNLAYVSEKRGISPEAFGRKMYQNLNRFLGGACGNFSDFLKKSCNDGSGSV
jgi:hypothetical protein